MASRSDEAALVALALLAWWLFDAASSPLKKPKVVTTKPKTTTPAKSSGGSSTPVSPAQLQPSSPVGGWTPLLSAQQIAPATPKAMPQATPVTPSVLPSSNLPNLNTGAITIPDQGPTFDFSSLDSDVAEADPVPETGGHMLSPADAAALLASLADLPPEGFASWDDYLAELAANAAQNAAAAAASVTGGNLTSVDETLPVATLDPVVLPSEPLQGIVTIPDQEPAFDFSSLSAGSAETESEIEADDGIESWEQISADAYAAGGGDYFFGL